jgi:parallel beta-helix repeat protein
MPGSMTRRNWCVSLRVATIAVLFGTSTLLAARTCWSQATCGQTVMTSVALTADLSCTGTGLIVGAPKVTIDLAGFTIGGDGDLGDVGIDNGGGFEKLTIKDGTISEFGEGISIGNNAQKNTIDNVTVFGCQTAGIDLNDSDAGKVKECIFNGIGGIGLVLGDGSTDNTVEKSTALGNGVAGFEMRGSNNTIKKTDVTGNSVGILLLGTGNVVSSCGIYRNSGRGVDVVGAGNEVSKSTIIGNFSEGIDVHGASGTAIERNTVSGNRQNGIFVRASADGTVVSRNEVVGNENQGIAVSADSDNVLVDGNTAIGNHIDGVQTDNPSTTIRKNTGNANGGFGIDALGAIDGGGNKAKANADGNCRGVFCK